MGTTLRTLIHILLLLVPGMRIYAQPVLTISAGKGPDVPGAPASFWLHALNPTSEPIDWTPPSALPCELVSTSATNTITAIAATPSSNAIIRVAPGTFARREYRLDLSSVTPGAWMLFPGHGVDAGLSLTVQPPPADPGTHPVSQGRGLIYFLKGRRHAAHAAEYDPDDFFKQHIFGYEPLYFLAGTESPNAKFQISFKYRLLNERGWIANEAPFLRGLHIAYSQTSLWDWNAPSAPFFDSSYRPELLYSWDRLLGGAATNWFRVDFQGGLQHESNGRDGDNSRSLNIAYLRPRITFGKDTGPQLTLMPRVWLYVGDVNDNPDIAEYRGYADLRAVFGWKRGLQLSALGRIGEDGDHGGLQLDATYPLMQQPSGSFSVYLHVQYFTGYGESLLDYRDETDILRAGFSLYR